ncbi:MAG TPA: hypothetical protein VIH82_04915 [Acidimicrobiia bacterium]
MAIVVILVLLALWAAVLIPPIMRSRAASGAAPGGIGEFVDRLRAGLGQAGPRNDGALAPLQPIMGPVGGPGPSMGPIRAPGGMTPAQRRRRDVLVVILGAMGLTFIMAVMASSPVFWVLHLLTDALLVGYCYLLLKHKAKVQARRATVSRPVTPVPIPSNVHHLDQTRRRPAIAAPSHVDAPREATVLALRRTAW